MANRRAVRGPPSCSPCTARRCVESRRVHGAASKEADGGSRPSCQDWAAQPGRLILASIRLADPTASRWAAADRPDRRLRHQVVAQALDGRRRPHPRPPSLAASAACSTCRLASSLEPGKPDSRPSPSAPPKPQRRPAARRAAETAGGLSQSKGYKPSIRRQTGPSNILELGGPFCDESGLGAVVGSDHSFRCITSASTRPRLG